MHKLTLVVCLISLFSLPLFSTELSEKEKAALHAKIKSLTHRKNSTDEILKIIDENHWNPNYQTEFSDWHYTLLAVSNCKLDLLKGLHDRGGALTAKHYMLGNAYFVLLQGACNSLEDSERVLSYLLQNKVPFNGKDSYGRNLTHYFHPERLKPETAKTLLTQGLDINQVDLSLFSPVGNALGACNLERVRFLLSLGGILSEAEGDQGALAEARNSCPAVYQEMKNRVPLSKRAQKVRVIRRK